MRAVHPREAGVLGHSNPEGKRQSRWTLVILVSLALDAFAGISWPFVALKLPKCVVEFEPIPTCRIHCFEEGQLSKGIAVKV